MKRSNYKGIKRDVRPGPRYITNRHILHIDYRRFTALYFVKELIYPNNKMKREEGRASETRYLATARL